MTKIVNMHEAKSNLSRLVEEVEAGEDVVLARAGKPVVRLVALRPARRRRLGRWKGKVTMADDFDAPLPRKLWPLGRRVAEGAVRVLLDTHALIWALERSPKLSKVARGVIEDGSNEILVSAASAWEIAINKALGRLEVPDDLIEAVDEAGFVRRPLGFAEAKRLESLPPHHDDPFDRMLVAHALEEGAAIVTRDRQIARYQVPIIW